jgi:Zn finger protein HypA/HybF involved in hydrogenase expression
MKRTMFIWWCDKCHPGYWKRQLSIIPVDGKPHEVVCPACHQGREIITADVVAYNDGDRRWEAICRGEDP